MRPPLAGRREAARRLAAELRGRLGPKRGGDAPRGPQPATGDDAAARIDAARERLRSTVAAPEDPAG
jgi:hypothetical protein